MTCLFQSVLLSLFSPRDVFCICPCGDSSVPKINPGSYPRKARTSPLLFPYSFEIFLMFSQPGMWLLFMLTYSGQFFHVFWCQFWEHWTKLFKTLNVSTTVLGDPVNDRFTITSSIPKVDVPNFSLAYRSLLIRCEKSFAPFLVALYQKYHMVSILMMMMSKCKGCLGFLQSDLSISELLVLNGDIFLWQLLRRDPMLIQQQFQLHRDQQLLGALVGLRT